jgi:hypothetical protein
MGHMGSIKVGIHLPGGGGKLRGPREKGERGGGVRFVGKGGLEALDGFGRRRRTGIVVFRLKFFGEGQGDEARCVGAEVVRGGGKAEIQ